MVFNGEFDEASRGADGGLAKGCVADTQHPKLGGQAIEVQADAVKVSIGGAVCQRRSDRILRSRILWHGFLIRVQQNGVDIGELSKGTEESPKLGPGPRSHGAGNQLILRRLIGLGVEYA